MRCAAFMLVCLARGNPQEAMHSWILTPCQKTQKARGLATVRGILDPLKTFAALLLSWSPVVSFSLCSRGTITCRGSYHFGLDKKSRFGHGFSVVCMSAPEVQLQRREALQTVTLTAAGLLAASISTESASAGALDADLVWQPRKKATTGRMVKTSYAPTFITYLARFLLNYDRGSAGWWVDQAQGLPLSLSRSALKSAREKQFGQFSESVEVGLQKYQGSSGVRALFLILKSRYAKRPECKIQLALLFSLISKQNQPVDLISRALGEADDATVVTVDLTSQGRGYSSVPPRVKITFPEGARAAARARAEVKPTGKVTSISLVDGGEGYTKAPLVFIKPPREGGKAAEAVARIENSSVVSLELTSSGSGYSEKDISTLEALIDLPRNGEFELSSEGRAAQAVVKMDFYVSKVVVENGGRGFARDQAVNVSIASPQESGGDPEGVTATGVANVDGARIFRDTAGMGPYSGAYTYGSVSDELLKLLPDSLRPLRKPRGFFAFPTSAANSAFLVMPSSDANATEPAMSAKALRRSRSQLLQRDPSFGPLGSSPVMREVNLGFKNYFGFAASGALCTGLVRGVLVPLDTSKTLMQSDPKKYPELPAALGELWVKGGLSSLYRSLDVTVVSGLLLGGFGFGFNEFLRRYFASLLGPQAETIYPLQISIAAALGSVLVTCIATCPFEVLRIRAIEDSGETQSQSTATQGRALKRSGIEDANAGQAHDVGRYSVVRGLGTLWDEGGLSLLYSALTPLLLRELPFSITKFLVYDLTTQAIAAAFPSAQEGPFQAALISLLSGLIAGIAGAAVSTPADTLLTLTQTPSGDGDGKSEAGEPPSLSAAFVDQLQKDPLGFFNGLLPRCVFFGALLAGQFGLYGYFKLFFKVSPDDLVYVLDVFADKRYMYN